MSVEIHNGSHSAARARAYIVAAILAGVFLAWHLPFLPASLEDIDSINFALGLRRFDVTSHQPHPPGYPLYIGIGKLVHAVVPDEARTLGVISALSGALGGLALIALFGRLDARSSPGWSIGAAILAVTSPLYWLTSSRPLSDVPGLAATTAVQALALASSTGGQFALAAFLASLAAGLRSQTVWLTVPLLALAVARRPAAERRQFAGVTAGAYIVGCSLWAVPLVALTGGIAGYRHALSSQGAEDLTGIQMLWTSPTPRVLGRALFHAFVAPWAMWPVAAVLLGLAVVGVSRLWRDNPATLRLIALAFGPYLFFDLLFQEAFTTRYALPLVVPVAFLAMQGLRHLPRPVAVVCFVALAMFDAHVGGVSVAAYARVKAPAFRMLDDMRSVASVMASPPVLAMDRRQQFDLRRPMTWAESTFASRQLPSPPQHEWLEAVNYWTAGGRAPVWFVADPLRADIELISHPERTGYRWGVPYPVLIDGIRPNELDWYRIDRPDWFVGKGWALTPESAGVADADRRGLAHGPITGWVAPQVLTDGCLVIGGRNFEPAVRPTLSVTHERVTLAELVLPNGPFVVGACSNGVFAGDGIHYRELQVDVRPRSRVAVEQFDASSDRTVFGFGEGWYEPEYNPSTGLRWRWLSERGELRLPSVTRGPMVLHIEGESPRHYFGQPSRFLVRGRDRVVRDVELADDFAIDVPLSAETIPDGIVTFETSQVYVPADRSWRTKDRRRLGLRIFRCELRRPSRAS